MNIQTFKIQNSRTAKIIEKKEADAEDIDAMMKRIDDLYAREKRKAATGKTDVDFAKLPVLKKFEERGGYVWFGPLGCPLRIDQASGSGQIGRGGGGRFLWSLIGA